MIESAEINLHTYGYPLLLLLLLSSHSVGSDSETPWIAAPQITAPQASLSLTIFWSLLKLMSIESVVPSNHLILCHPLFLLPSIFPSIEESALCSRWPNIGASALVSISISNEHSGLISFRIDWFDLLAVQGTLKSLLQHHNLKIIPQCSHFFMIQLSHPC